MRPLETLTAGEILAIPDTEPERLFAGDASGLKLAFGNLVKRWHPDHNGGSAEATAVFAKLVELRNAASARLAGHPDPRVVRIESVDGHVFELAAKRRHAFELGEMAIASRHVAFTLNKEFEALFRAGIRRMEAIAYPNATVRRDLGPFMPKPLRVFETERSHVVVLEKPGEAVLLADLAAHLGGKIPAPHVAWMVSSLLNIANLFAVAGLTHNALTTGTVFVSPPGHAAYVLGGWWYATPAGLRLDMLPEATHALLQPAMQAAKRADIRLDLECIRAIGRELLGDPTGSGLARRPDVPRPMADFLRLPGSGSALEDYRTWTEVLRESFGPRRFVALPVSFSDVYR